MTIEQPAWTGMVPVDDTALAVTDTGGPGRPVVYLNGSYADQSHWRRVIADLGSGYRHITYDERARGKSKRSADYSFEACLRDLDAVLAARGVDRPILVGWSYGAMLAVHWAARNPDRVLGVVLVDGAYPHDWLDDAAEQRIRKLFRRLSPCSPIAAPARPGRADDRRTARRDQHRDQRARGATSTRSSTGVTGPVRYVVASGGHLGADARSMEGIRANLDPVLARNPNIQVSAKVASNHSKILRKDFRAIADAVREIAVTCDHAVG